MTRITEDCDWEKVTQSVDAKVVVERDRNRRAEHEQFKVINVFTYKLIIRCNFDNGDRRNDHMY